MSNTPINPRNPRNAGRKPGSSNANSILIKQMIINALEGAGGVKYLVEQAHKNPAAFMQLVGKVIPLQVDATHAGSGNATINITYLKSEPMPGVVIDNQPQAIDNATIIEDAVPDRG